MSAANPDLEVRSSGRVYHAKVYRSARCNLWKRICHWYVCVLVRFYIHTLKFHSLTI